MKENNINLDKYNVVWHNLGLSDRSSMPLGNGETGINLWVQKDQGLHMYIGRTDAQTEVDRNVKLGKIKLELVPNPFVEGAEFTQELILREGCINITANNNRHKVSIKTFVDADDQNIYIDIKSNIPVKANAQLYNWRTAKNIPWGIPQSAQPNAPLVEETADVVAKNQQGVVFYHKNGTTCVRGTAEIEAVADYMDAIIDTLKDRTFGGYMTMNNTTPTSDFYLLADGEHTEYTLKVNTFSRQMSDTNALINEVINTHNAMPSVEDALLRTNKFWNDYFNDSYIYVNGDKEVTTPIIDKVQAVVSEPQEPMQVDSKVTQSYILTKFMHACASKGKMPLLFNGLTFNLMPGLESHFVFDTYCVNFSKAPKSEPTLEFNPDEKGWESCINLWQNVRLPYAAMLSRGEFAAVKGLFAYYRRFWDINKIRAKLYYDAEGQYNTEMTNTFGLMPMSVYGADREGVKDGYALNRCGGAVDISPGLELASMMLDYYEYTMDAEFLKNEALPYAQDILHYIETRFKERANGKIHMTDLQSVETYVDTTNPITVVSGMHAVCQRVLNLPKEMVDTREFFESYVTIMPDIPMELDDKNNTVIAPAEEYKKERQNCENPTLYPIYPFRSLTAYKPNLKLAQDTYEYSKVMSNSYVPFSFDRSPGFPCYSGWEYHGMVAALLGTEKDASEVLTNNCALKNPGTKFPAMWGPIHDSVPDGDHGANITNTLQLMALQSEGDKIYVLPAWPKDWDISFKLYTMQNTIVECVYKDKEIKSIKVTPENRQKDLIICV